MLTSHQQPSSSIQDMVDKYFSFMLVKTVLTVKQALKTCWDQSFYCSRTSPSTGQRPVLLLVKDVFQLNREAAGPSMKEELLTQTSWSPIR